jgi:acetylornithine deacetylase/succinyl-diaminopimelate desuccinylase-like protein
MLRRILVLVIAASTAAAQDVSLQPNPTMTPRLRAALDTIRADNAWTIQQQKSICEIPSPPFKEKARGVEMKRRFELLGYHTIIDSMGNVIAEKTGDGSSPRLVIAGHLDTVFPEGTDVKVKQAGTKMSAPGISDDCRGLAVVLSVARGFARAKVETKGTVYFVANVGEEGPGNLRGTRYLFEHSLKGKIDAFVSVDGGGNVGSITNHAVGSIRYKLTYHGPGGHSYGAFGTANPIHALGRAIAMIDELQVPSNPKTTFNVGVIEGGTSVNSIPFSASAEIDMRSVTAEELNKVNARMLAIFASARDAENARWNPTDADKRITFTLDTIGVRPANSQQTEATAIVRVAATVAQQLGGTVRLGASSTDANLPMSIGIPAITINGGGHSQGSHSLNEWYDDGADGWKGPQWAALIVAAIVGVKG